jgi:hypothetical protein
VGFERVVDGHSGKNGRLDLVIRLSYPRKKVDDLIDLVFWDNNYAVDWVTKDKVTRINNRAIDNDRHLHGKRNASCPRANDRKPTGPDLQLLEILTWGYVRGQKRGKEGRKRGQEAEDVAGVAKAR